MRRRSKMNAEDQPSRGSRFPRSNWILRLFLLMGLLAAVSIFLAPRFLASPALVNSAIARFGGLEPIRIQVGGLSIGWMSPATVSDLQLIDQSGAVLAKVRSIHTQKGIIGWIGNPLNLGTITVDGVEAEVVAHDGSTNLEQSLEAFLAPRDETSQEPYSKRLMAGTIVVTDAKFMLRQPGSPEQWLVEVPLLSAELPREDQLFGPIELKAKVSEISGLVPNSLGQILAKAEQTQDNSIELRAMLDNLSLDFWHVLQARLSWIPVIAMSGRASGKLAGNALDADNWTFDLQQIQVTNFEMTAPDLIGPAPARLASIAAGGRVTLASQMIQLVDTSLVCDIGQLQASASLPWPVNIPSMTNPFIEGAVLSASGNLDLPQLVQAAESLLPMREDVQLVSGRVRFAVDQQALHNSGSSNAGTETNLKLIFSEMQALSDGQQITWNEPLSVNLMAGLLPSGLRYQLVARAEFCDLHGAGTFENGQLAGNVNLDLLHRRLSQFMDLPVSTMTGSANMDIQWKMNDEQQVDATGTLQTTPLVIATPSGGQMLEPAWNGKFTASAQQVDGTPRVLNRMHFELIADDEQLVADLHEPVSLISDETASVIPPAAFSLSLSGDLANWKRRGWVWLMEPPDMEIGGNIQLAVSGHLDIRHVEVSQANWDSKLVSLRTADFAMAEPQLIGNFKGRIDTSDLTRLQVEQLTVQANSFWIMAQDESAEDGNARSGQARWMLDIQRFMQNLNAASSNQLVSGKAASSGGASNILASSASVAPQSAYSASGTVQGGLNWLVAQAGASFALQASGENILFNSLAPGASAPSPLWAEPTLAAAVNGKWTAADGAIDLTQLKLKTQWMDYQGNLAYRTQEGVQTLDSEGQAMYDAALLSTKLEPMIGKNIQLVGKQTVPVKVRWHRDSQSSSPALAGLQASTRLGWQQARVIGIDVGRADVPVTIDSGILASAAEISVSGGKLRWDIASDLTQDSLVIEQKPMVVLENVAITPEMCSGWLKYVAPLMAETTSIDGRLSLVINQALLTPTDLGGQTVDGQLVMHRAQVGPGPLANEITGLIRQIDAIRRADPSQADSSQNRVWIQLPEQNIAFRMVEGKVYHRDLRFDVGEATLTTAGAVDVHGQLEMLVSLPIPDAWSQRGPVLAALRGQTLQFPLRGSVARPQLDASLLGQLGRQTIENAAQGLLQQGINRGLERLFRQQ